jgi:hypothetical protein
MTIKYALFQNRLTADPNDYAARVQQTGSINLDGLAQRIIDQGSTVTMPDILAVLENMIQATESFLLEGYRVNLGGLCELYPRLKGSFLGITDSFNNSRHRLELGAKPGSRLRTAFREKAAVVKAETILPAPSLLNFIDQASGLTDGQVTPGNIGTINGHRLKFDPLAPDEGIYFIDSTGGTEYKVTLLQKNKPSQLVFLVPAIPASLQLFLEVRVHYGTELRTGRLDALLPT